MKSNIYHHYINKIRILLLKKLNLVNTYDIPYIKNISLNLEAQFKQDSNLEKKKILLLIELISGQKPKIIVNKTNDSTTYTRYVVRFNKMQSLNFLYKFNMLILPQLKFFRYFDINEKSKSNHCLFNLKDPAVFFEINNQFELFPTYDSITNFMVDIEFSTSNKQHIMLLLNSFNIPCRLI